MGTTSTQPLPRTITGSDTLRIRKALGLTQLAWAKRLGVQTVVTVSRWENGQHNPAIHFHAKIRAAAREAGVELS